MAATLFNIPVNEKLIWDYQFESQDYHTERFFKWYLARVLDNGTSRDITQITFKIIAKYLSSLRISWDVRPFWEWYFQNVYIRIAVEILTEFQKRILLAISLQKVNLVEELPKIVAPLTIEELKEFLNNKIEQLMKEIQG